MFLYLLYIVAPLLRSQMHMCSAAKVNNDAEDHVLARSARAGL